MIFFSWLQRFFLNPSTKAAIGLLLVLISVFFYHQKQLLTQANDNLISQLAIEKKEFSDKQKTLEALSNGQGLSVKKSQLLSRSEIYADINKALTYSKEKIYLINLTEKVDPSHLALLSAPGAQSSSLFTVDLQVIAPYTAIYQFINTLEKKMNPIFWHVFSFNMRQYPLGLVKFKFSLLTKPKAIQ